MTTQNELKRTPAAKGSRKSMRIYQDQIKTDYTSHWDWDYLPRDEVARLAATCSHQAPVPANGVSDPRPSTRPFLFGALGAAAAATISGLLLFAG